MPNEEVYVFAFAVKSWRDGVNPGIISSNAWRYSSCRSYMEWKTRLEFTNVKGFRNL